MSTPKSLEINCLAFERVLDEGTLRRLPAAALAHAQECARCARSLARARSLEGALARHFASEPGAADAVPASFTDRVMARVERGEARGVRWLTLPDALPWWVRAAADPAVLLACTVTAILLWRGDALVASVRAWLPVVATTPLRLADAAQAVGLDAPVRALASAFPPGGGAPWAVTTGLALGLLPLLALMAFAGWRAGERIAGTGTLRHL